MPRVRRRSRREIREISGKFPGNLLARTRNNFPEIVGVNRETPVKGNRQGDRPHPSLFPDPALNAPDGEAHAARGTTIDSTSDPRA